MDEQALNEALGLEPKEDESIAEENEHETVPDGENQAEGTEDGSGEDGSSDSGDGNQGSSGGDEQPGADGETGGSKSKPAATRDELIAEARRIAQAEKAREMDEFVKGLNLIDPKTHKRVETVAEYNEYRVRVNSETRERILKKAGLSEDKFKEFVNAQPEVSEARAAAAQAQRERAKAAIDDQVRQIHELDPTINAFEDLGKMENFQQFYGLVKKNGLSLVDAYKLVNMDRLTERRVEASRQAARNAAASKAHLTKNKARGGAAADIPVPADVAEMYRELDPGISNADMQRDYSRYAAKHQKGV